MKKIYCCPICRKQTHGILQQIDDFHTCITQTKRKTIERFYHNHPEIKRKKINDSVNTNNIESEFKKEKIVNLIRFLYYKNN